MTKLLLAIVPLSVSLSAHVAYAEEPAALSEPAQVASPELRYPPSSVRPKLILGGLVVSGLAYAASIGSAVSWPEVPGIADLKIPIVGPWLALGKSGCASDDPDCGAKVYVRGVFYVLDGIAQLAGLGLIGEGIFMKTEGKPASKKGLAFSLPGGVTLHPVPVADARTKGLGLVGTF